MLAQYWPHAPNANTECVGRSAAAPSLTLHARRSCTLSALSKATSPRAFSAPHLLIQRKCPAVRPEDRGTRGQKSGSPLIRSLSPNPASELICLNIQLLISCFLFVLYIELQELFVAIRVPYCGWLPSRFSDPRKPIYCSLLNKKCCLSSKRAESHLFSR